jgi:hypothetical protein
MKPLIGLFVHQPVCSVQSINGIVKALESDYRFRFFGKNEMQAGFFQDLDMVCFPGGVGDSDRFDTLVSRNVDSLGDYIRQGGRYLGICMGAYWADADYLDILPMGNRVVQYIKQPGTDTRRPHPKACAVTWQGQAQRMYFYDGSCITGHNLDSVATYSNGDTMAAISGKIGLIGCHLESEEFWYDKSYLKPHWHQGRHHALLKSFVDKLMER